MVLTWGVKAAETRPSSENDPVAVWYSIDCADSAEMPSDAALRPWPQCAKQIAVPESVALANAGVAPTELP